MSIKGVDAQIMTTRAPDFVREASSQLKGGERMQEFLATQAQSEAEHDKASVHKTDASPKSELQPKKEGDTGSGYSSSGKRGGKGEQADDALLNADVGSADNIIDILL